MVACTRQGRQCKSSRGPHTVGADISSGSSMKSSRGEGWVLFWWGAGPHFHIALSNQKLGIPICSNTVLSLHRGVSRMGLCFPDRP